MGTAWARESLPGSRVASEDGEDGEEGARQVGGLVGRRVVVGRDGGYCWARKIGLQVGEILGSGNCGEMDLWALGSGSGGCRSQVGAANLIQTME